MARAVDSALADDDGPDEGRAEIIIIDNGSRDGSLEPYRKSDGSRIRLIELDQNLGFARACNLGIQVARGAELLFLNPDCRLYPGALARLRRTLKDGGPRVAMVGPRLVNPDGSEQRGGRRDIPNPWQIFCVVLQLHRLMPNHPRFRDFNRHVEPVPAGPIAVPAISGACMLIRREAITQVGKLDGNYFLHFEDLDWCVRCDEAKWRILFDPGATVEHTQGVCSRHRPVATEFAKHRSLIYFLRKHFTSYYPSSFMALVSALVMVRFALTLPGTLYRSLFKDRDRKAMRLDSATRPGR